MTKITVIAENAGLPDARFRALADDRESVGSSPGTAVGALIDQLDRTESGTLVIVQEFQPDRYFTQPQRDRLAALMEKRRAEQAAGRDLRESERAELESLVDAELDGATQRAAAMARELRL